MAFSRPAHPRVTLTVGQLGKHNGQAGSILAKTKSTSQNVEVNQDIQHELFEAWNSS